MKSPRKRPYPRVIPKIDRDTLLYLAGLVDGEGCIRIGRARKQKNKSDYCYTAEVKVVLTHEGAIKFMADKLARPYMHLKAREGENWKDTYRVSIHDIHGITSFLEQIIPFLIVKKQAAEVVLEFCKSRGRSWPSDNYNRAYSENELQLCTAIKEINRRGRIEGTA